MKLESLEGKLFRVWRKQNTTYTACMGGVALGGVDVICRRTRTSNSFSDSSGAGSIAIIRDNACLYNGSFRLRKAPSENA